MGDAQFRRTSNSRLWDAYAAVYDLGVTRLAPYRQLQDDLLGLVRGEAERMRRAGHRRRLRLLDLCCGTGNHLARLLSELDEVSGTGVDLSPAMLRVARRKCRRPGAVRWLCGDAMRVLRQLPAASYDLVLMCNSFYPQPRKAELLAELRRILHPEGALVLSDPLRGANLLTLLFEHLRVEGPVGLYVLPMLCASSLCSLLVQADAAKTFYASQHTRILLEQAGLTTRYESRTYAGASYLLVARPALHFRERFRFP